MILLAIALALLAVPAWGAVRWLLITARGVTRAEAVAAFLEVLPEVLRDQPRATAVFVACGVAACLVAWFALRTVAAVVRTVAVAVIGLAALLVLWHLWTLL